MEKQVTILDDLIDEFCFELAAILRRVLGLVEEESDDDDDE